MSQSSSKLAIHGGIPVRSVPFTTWPIIHQEDEESLLSVFRGGSWWKHSFGGTLDASKADQSSRVLHFQEAFKAFHGSRYAIANANGTASLEVVIRALELEVGSEVIVPAYTFIATATCVLQSNLIPIFADIEADTYNIDPDSIEAAITDRTRAIVVVHFAGQLANMERIIEIADKYNLHVIEDAAHAHGATRNGEKAGAYSSAACFSFQHFKNMTGGEGGIVLSNSKLIAERVESLVWGGRTTKGAWYEHEYLGWNYRMTEFQAAVLLPQLNRLQEQMDAREHAAQYLSSLLSTVDHIRVFPMDSKTTRHAYHIYVFEYDELSGGISREMFLSALQAEGIPAFEGYPIPVYRNPLFRDKNFINGAFPLGSPYHADIEYLDFSARCPVAEKVCASSAVWLPQHVLLGPRCDIEDIAAAVRKVVSHLCVPRLEANVTMGRV